MFTNAGVMSNATPKRDSTTRTGEISNTNIKGANQFSTLATPQASNHVKTLDKRADASSILVIAATALSQ